MDMSNGMLDGLDASGAAILVPTDPTGATTAPLPALSATDLSAWLIEANAYAGAAIFPVDIVWNPAPPPGSIDYTTYGSSLPSGTATPDTTYASGAMTWTWKDRPNHIEITIVLADQVAYPGSVETVQFSYNSGEYFWTAHGVSGVANVTISGGTTRFENVALAELLGGTSTVSLTGTLINP
jgi:hypothetical protein